MDTRTDLRILNELWASGHAPWKIWESISDQGISDQF
jgi:hypothetical protein